MTSTATPRTLAAGFAALLTLSSVADIAVAQPPPGGRAAHAARLVRTADAFRRAGDPASALGYYREAIRAHPDAAEAYVGLAAVYLARGSVQDALEAVEAGLRRRPDHAPLWLAKAACLEHQGRRAEALGTLRALVTDRPEHAEAHLRRARLARALGAFAEALASYRALLDLAARGEAVAAEAVAEARLYAPALARLTVGLDPPSDCAAEGPVRDVLAGC